MAVVALPMSTDAAESPAGEGYRPHLDGLRAVAVYLVVLFHAGIARFSGGFIGVDVFFVLSGYLVTQLLMRDLSSRGRIRFGRFYARRMRRLLPAAFVTLIVTAVVYSAVASRAEMSAAVDGFKAAFLYVANWFFIHRSANYFAADIDTNPVVHFWSLAIEEQFYLLWPLLLGGLFVATRRLHRNAHRAMQLAVGAGALLSVSWALRLADTNLNRAYYGTDARAYELLAGAALALAPGVIRRASRYRVGSLAAGSAVVVLGLLSTSLFDLSAIHRGIATTITTVVLIVAIESAGGGPVNRLLSSRPLVYLGKISYGTYLWHWPVILVAFALTDRTIGPFSTFGIAALVATGLASLSYTILERPIREERFFDRFNPAVIGAGLSIGVLSALVIIPHVLDPYRARAETPVGHAVQAAKIGFTRTSDLDFDAARSVGNQLVGVQFLKTWNCLGKPVETCTILDGTSSHILVIGDSTAWMMFPTFAAIAQKEGLTLSTAAVAGCPWQRNLYLSNDRVAVLRDHRKKCEAMKRDLYERVIPRLKPDLIVAVSNDYIDGNVSRFAVVEDQNNRPLHSDSTKQLQNQAAVDTRHSLTLLEASGAKVLIVEPVPITTPDRDPYTCLTKSTLIEECRFVTDAQPTAQELMYRADAGKRVSVANFDKLMCPFLPICDPVIGGRIVRFDNQHITASYALSIAGDVTTFLQDEGLIPR